MPPNRQQRVTDYVRRDGTKVRSHTRSAQWARAKSTWIGAGFSTLVAAGILWEFGITLISTACVVLTALLGTIAVIAGNYVESNRKMMAQQRTRATRTTRTSRAGGATRTRSASSSRRTSGRRTSGRRCR